MFLLLTGLSMAAEPNIDKGTFGLSFSLGDLALSGSDYVMGGQYFLAKKRALRAGLLLNTEADALGANASMRSYVGSGAARPFWEAGGGIVVGYDLAIIGLGLVGGEVWLKPNLSIWGATGLEVLVDDGVNLATRTSALNLAIYF